jgi:NADH dehydrogenase [ubiquinone] 1 alpha subcomplex assembly factor 6
MKGWFMKVINAREQYMDNSPYTSMDALETYAENTYSTLMYLTLAALPLHSMEADHVASHIGKATGIAAVLRGLPLIAFPPPPNHHSNNAAFGGALGGSASGRQGAVVLPLDVMAETGVKEEEVFRKGADAPGLKDAIFTVATRANDHLITAREMLKNLQQGRDAGHEFEHEGEEGHQYVEPNGNTKSDLERGFGVLMQAVPTRLWLERLEKHDFDVFNPDLRAREWKLPWKAYWAYSRRAI